MEIEEFKNFLESKKNENKIKTKINMEKAYTFMKNTLEWNEKINLTNIKEEKEFIVKHIIDSLTITRYLEDNKKLIDIGTGGGFPGIPIKLCFNNMKETLIDSVGKKINIVKDNIEKLELNNIEAIHIRSEQLAKNIEYREKFDYATTRAVSNLSTISEYMLPFLKIGGKAICMKGPNYEEELKEAKKAIEVLGGTIEKIENIKLDNEYERNIIIIKKIKSTPSKYPRDNGKPLKNPIK